MNLREFGSTPLRVSEFGLGCARLGGVFQSNARGFVDLLDFAFDAGITFFDTADMYSQGESESLLGKAFRKKRSRVIIASKVGYCLPAQRRLAGKLKPILRPVVRWLKVKRTRLSSTTRGALTQDFSPKYVMQAVEGSLRRLRTDYLDVLQLHSPPREIIERGEWLHALEELKRRGKIRHFGIAVDTIDAGLAALEVPGVSSIQFTLNLLEQGGAAQLFPDAAKRGIAGIARECLANGLLVKPIEGLDMKVYCSSPEQEELRRRQLAELREAERQSGTSLLRQALDYPRSVPGVSVVLLGARSIEQLRPLLAAT